MGAHSLRRKRRLIPHRSIPRANDLPVHPNGTVWVTSVHGAFAYNGEEWVQYGVEDGLSDEGANFVEVGPDGSIYIGTRLGVTRISAESD